MVDQVIYSQTQISVADARRFQYGAKLGETITLAFQADRSDVQNMMNAGQGVLEWLGAEPSASRFAVEFHDLTVSVANASNGTGNVVTGTVKFPADESGSEPIKILVDGFVFAITLLELSATRAVGSAEVTLPPTIVDAASCEAAVLTLNRITLSPQCDVYVDAPDQVYGPWLLGDTGMVFQGKGYVLDMSKTKSPKPLGPAWRGLVLGAGTASGAGSVPDPATRATCAASTGTKTPASSARGSTEPSHSRSRSPSAQSTRSARP